MAAVTDISSNATTVNKDRLFSDLLLAVGAKKKPTSTGFYNVPACPGCGKTGGKFAIKLEPGRNWVTCTCLSCSSDSLSADLYDSLGAGAEEFLPILYNKAAWESQDRAKYANATFVRDPGNDRPAEKEATGRTCEQILDTSDKNDYIAIGFLMNYLDCTEDEAKGLGLDPVGLNNHRLYYEDDAEKLQHVTTPAVGFKFTNSTGLCALEVINVQPVGELVGGIQRYEKYSSAATALQGCKRTFKRNADKKDGDRPRAKDACVSMGAPGAAIWIVGEGVGTVAAACLAYKRQHNVWPRGLAFGDVQSLAKAQFSIRAKDKQLTNIYLLADYLDSNATHIKADKRRIGEVTCYHLAHQVRKWVKAAKLRTVGVSVVVPVHEDLPAEKGDYRDYAKKYGYEEAYSLFAKAFPDDEYTLPPVEGPSTEGIRIMDCAVIDDQQMTDQEAFNKAINTPCAEVDSKKCLQCPYSFMSSATPAEISVTPERIKNYAYLSPGQGAMIDTRSTEDKKECAMTVGSYNNRFFDDNVKGQMMGDYKKHGHRRMCDGTIKDYTMGLFSRDSKGRLMFNMAQPQVVLPREGATHDDIPALLEECAPMVRMVHEVYGHGLDKDDKPVMTPDMENVFWWRCASLIQNPGVKLHTALATMSEAQRIGKGLVASPLRYALGRGNYKVIKNKTANDNFDSWRDRAMHIYEEAEFTPAMIAQLKISITEEEDESRAMYSEGRTIDNIAWILVHTNKRDFMPFDPNDRRWIVHQSGITADKIKTLEKEGVYNAAINWLTVGPKEPNMKNVEAWVTLLSVWPLHNYDDKKVDYPNNMVQSLMANRATGPEAFVTQAMQDASEFAANGGFFTGQDLINAAARHYPPIIISEKEAARLIAGNNLAVSVVRTSVERTLGKKRMDELGITLTPATAALFTLYQVKPQQFADKFDMDLLETDESERSWSTNSDDRRPKTWNENPKTYQDWLAIKDWNPLDKNRALEYRLRKPFAGNDGLAKQAGLLYFVYGYNSHLDRRHYDIIDKVYCGKVPIKRPVFDYYGDEPDY